MSESSLIISCRRRQRSTNIRAGGEGWGVAAAAAEDEGGKRGWEVGAVSDAHAVWQTASPQPTRDPHRECDEHDRGERDDVPVLGALATDMHVDAHEFVELMAVVKRSARVGVADVRRLPNSVGSVPGGVWRVAYGGWRVAGGGWRVAYGVWRVVILEFIWLF